MEQTQPDRATHWQNVYLTKADRETSWFQDEPATSLALVREAIGSTVPVSIIDIGGGNSDLGGRLAADGHEVTVIDISPAALERAQRRIGSALAERIRWTTADVTALDDLGQCDVWHDRAVFHFLTDARDRRRYTALASRTVKLGGHLIVATFATDGPEKCSGLPVERYDAAKLTAEFGADFGLVRSFNEVHTTPSGKPQSFFFAVLRRSDLHG
jgi:2-polyprenyl-3-methyl-5-hydroxy-6-metoxy-1,4-benzoquinol methylase